MARSMAQALIQCSTQSPNYMSQLDPNPQAMEGTLYRPTTWSCWDIIVRQATIANNQEHGTILLLAYLCAEMVIQPSHFD